MQSTSEDKKSVETITKKDQFVPSEEIENEKVSNSLIF